MADITSGKPANSDGRCDTPTKLNCFNSKSANSDGRCDKRTSHDYAELKCKTNFTFLRGASHPDELVVRAEGLGLAALAINDANGVYGLPKAYWATKQLENFKLIAGAELTLDGHPPLTLLAKDRAGYGLMCRLLTLSHQDKEKGKASLSFAQMREVLQERAVSGLFALCEPQSRFQDLKEIFGEQIFFSLSRFRDGFDHEKTMYAYEIERNHEIKIVATNDVLYHDRTRRPMQDAFTAIREGASLIDAGFKLLPNAERYLKSPFEMRLLFKDFPEALNRTVQIAEQCVFSMSELKYRYPSEWIPSTHTAQSYLEELTFLGAQKRYRNQIPEKVMSQLKHELSLIEKLSFADYFLNIYDIVDFANKRDILCQGRGSAANSVVCYCLGITAIDPVQMNLLFERFISVERHEPPDIDVDFEHERREEVIQYIYEKYGRDRAAMVSAVVTYRKRSALREVAKAFGINVGTLSSKKLLKDFEQYERQSPIPQAGAQIAKIVEEMTSFPRHLSIHSGGFTLSADPITEIVPVEPARMPGRTIIQWDKYDLDYLGLLKIDVLALGMLSAVKKTLDLVGSKLYEIPHEDRATYEMIQKADTVGTFQVESRAQMNMSGRLRPRTFYDLVVQVAIVRPGPIVGQMVHPYLKRRNGIEQVHYPHPKLKEILGKTLGVPLFQEQLMKIAIELGEFTPGESDHLRRAIGAWRSQGSIQKVAEKLLGNLKKNGIPEDYALNLFEHMKGFAHYGFPESHAASFALISYASCFLKKHHPAEFACGLLNSYPMGFYQPHSIVDDAKRHGVKVFPIDPNRSSWNCTIENGALRMGLRMVHGLSEKDAAVIVEARPYESLADFLKKTNVRKDVLHRLAMGDAFKSFGEDQRHTLWRILAEKIKCDSHQLDLFSGYTEFVSERSPPKSNEQFSSITPAEKYFAPLGGFEAIKSDYEAYGLSVRGHPMSELRKVKKLPRLTTFEAKRTPPKKYVRTSGLLLVRQRPPTANGVCFAALEDEHGFLDLVLFRREYEKFKDIFSYHCFLIVGGYIERAGHSVSLIVKSLEPVWSDESTSSESLIVEPTQYY